MPASTKTTPILEPPTKRQREIYDFLVLYRERHGYSPSFREIMERFAIESTNAVRCHLVALERRGMVRAPKGRIARAWIPVDVLGAKRSR